MRESNCFEALCNTADGVFITDADKHIIRWNKGAERILGRTEADVVNCDCFHVISGKSLPGGNVCRQDCIIHRNGIMGTLQENFDLQTKTADGTPLWLNITVVSGAGTGIPCVAHIFRDVTREKNVTIALNQFLLDLNSHHPSSGNNGQGKQSLMSFPDAKKSSGKHGEALSGREVEVLTLLAEGLSTKSLAQKLSISQFTARNHIQNILVKLDLHSKAQAVSYAFKKGFL
ncbi:MAG TPA: LuxR C-terminal-related transcriptional regulator [Acidobacteriota bacterium]|nr:LuxR C-terminal-related transcriptional regulator [Acidobacteriota bacterium]